MNTWLPFITGLVGVIIGSASSIITIFIQLRAQNKREKTRLACELAIEDYKTKVDAIIKTGQGGRFYPIATYVYANAKIIEAVYDGKFSKEEYRKIIKENKDICRVCDEFKGSDC